MSSNTLIILECHKKLKANFYDLGTTRKWASFTKGRISEPQTHIHRNKCDQASSFYCCLNLDHALEAVVLQGPLNCFLFPVDCIWGIVTVWPKDWIKPICGEKKIKWSSQFLNQQLILLNVCYKQDHVLSPKVIKINKAMRQRPDQMCNVIKSNLAGLWEKNSGWERRD